MTNTKIAQQKKSSQTKSGRAFIVDAKATMLKKHPDLSKHTRNLYGTLRALADGKTGELRINGRWLKATVFDHHAEMCRDVRMRAMRELIKAGHVIMTRPRISRLIKGRIRIVRGESQYKVLRDPQDSSTVDAQETAPKTRQNPNNPSVIHDSSTVDAKTDSRGLEAAKSANPTNSTSLNPILLQSIPSTVEEIDSQYLPIIPNPLDAGAPRGLQGVTVALEGKKTVDGCNNV